MKWVLVIVCAYEAVALVSKRIPPITSLVWASRGTKLGPVAVAGSLAFAGWLVWHLVFEGR